MQAHGQRSMLWHSRRSTCLRLDGDHCSPPGRQRRAAYHVRYWSSCIPSGGASTDSIDGSRTVPVVPSTSSSTSMELLSVPPWPQDRTGPSTLGARFVGDTPIVWPQAPHQQASLQLLRCRSSRWSCLGRPVGQGSGLARATGHAQPPAEECLGSKLQDRLPGKRLTQALQDGCSEISLL